MKKNFVFLFTVVSMIVLTSCGGEKKAAAPAVQEPPKPEVVQTVAEPEKPAAPTLTPAEMLKSFQDYAKEYGESFNGLPRTVTKFSQLSKQSQQKVIEMDAIKDKLTAKQKQDYQKALDVVLKVNRGGK